MGFSAGDAAEVASAFELVRSVWREAGVTRMPRLVTGFWYALGPGAEERLQSYVFDYLRLFGDKPARAMAQRCRIHSVERFRECAEAIAALGADGRCSCRPPPIRRTRPYAEALAGCKGIA
jgi:hypothetical protein